MEIATHGWSEDRTQRAVKLWAEGYSAAQIAKELGGVTRNSVIGKIHRLGLARKAPRAPKQARVRPPRRTQAYAKPKLQPTPPAPEPLSPMFKVSLLQLNAYTCRYPIGDPQDADFTFCGRTSSPDHPYCIGHSALCFQPVKPRQKRATERLANWLDRRTFKVVA